MKAHSAVLVTLAVAAAATPVCAETTYCTPITQDMVPYTITAQGVYCFTDNVKTAIIGGNAITIAANKTDGIRAALCHDGYTAKGARLWNDANVLTLSMRLTPEILLEEILDAWFENKYVAGENEDVDGAIQALYNLEN